MPKEKVSSLSKFKSYEEMADFWDQHSLADCEDNVEEIEMTFEPAVRQTMIRVEPELYETIRHIAHEKKPLSKR